MGPMAFTDVSVKRSSFTGPPIVKTPSGETGHTPPQGISLAPSVSHETQSKDNTLVALKQEAGEAYGQLLTPLLGRTAPPGAQGAPKSGIDYLLDSATAVVVNAIKSIATVIAEKFGTFLQQPAVSEAL